MKKLYTIIFISFLTLSLITITGITAPNEKMKIYFEKTPSFYSGDSGEFSIVFDNTSNSILKNINIYVKDEYFELNKNKFIYGELQPGEKKIERIRYTVKAIDPGTYPLKVTTQYSYQVYCSGLKCDYASEGFLQEVPFRIDGVRTPIISLKDRSFEIKEVPYSLPIYIANRGSTVKNSYMIMEYDKSKFNLDYTENIGVIASLVKKEIVVTKIPETPGEYTIYLNLEIKDMYDKSTYLKFPIKLIINPIDVVKLDPPSELKTNEVNDTKLTLGQTTPQSKVQKPIFTILQEAILVLTLSGLIATISLMLLSRR
ncbi:MAG: hypothetical protein APG08_00963 [Candidatus Methanofastidiosum methylothiophilum]|uniref:CARDB domain-containing protein n=1 Tax=Candidatus Methanofastidiosum methylothiophilum TaxID=1705564 RepID=A0A150JGZ6_9EURY|nr:MAG: hypothetical protein AN188_00596 [Candidatus Methanofastidiosum methylthiophilus]OQC52663.1 MAG: hypothetical protein BWX56_00091 [Euryarchaeota archaeon ADurb.Bin023]HOE93216.1 hypothetical protein [Methanofastidiosum sp.]KYC56476.1 MAG: hypothetical protein APG08_00963 [Candidatus Methanofastidiosum methylthiophilus]KYC58323.1 MAG: hypothetical protein APG09_00342 [Candidatus Methanofastidiosum methylthiophilus]